MYLIVQTCTKTAMRIRDEQQMASRLAYIPLKAEAVQASEQRSLDSACSAPSKGLVDTAYSAHLGGAPCQASRLLYLHRRNHICAFASKNIQDLC